MLDRPSTVSFRESPTISTDPANEIDEKEPEERLLCRECYQIITRPADRISINGMHHHVFANPLGIVYEIGCFRSVNGCGYTGEASTEFTWFPGYSWRILICTGCLSHLGWAFTAGSENRFYGLILSHLVLG